MTYCKRPDDRDERQMDEKFETAEDVARWLEERGFSQDVTDAFIGTT